MPFPKTPRIADVEDTPLPSWVLESRPFTAGRTSRVTVPARLRDGGYSRATLGIAWRLASKQWDRVQPGANGDLVVH